MSDLQGSHPPELTSTVHSGVHYDRVISVIPKAVRNASPAQLKKLISTHSEMPEWYLSASAADRNLLKQLLEEHWRLQGELDQLFEGLQHDIEAFAEPLLKGALKAFNIDEDPKTLSLQLTVPSKIIFGIDTGASVIRTSSLLVAALHNFAEAETQAETFRAGSGVFRNDAQGAPVRLKQITVQQFATLCRTLDIGAQYHTHIQAQLRPADLNARRTLAQRSIASEKAAFKYSALVSRLKRDISTQAYDSLQGIVEGKRSIKFYGRPLLNHRVSLMGFKLTGITLFSALIEPSEIKKAIEELTPQGLKFWLDWSRRIPALSGNVYEKYKFLQNFFANGPQGVVDETLRNEDIYHQSRLNGPVIAYIPDDPECPLKEYASLADFMAALVGRLHTQDYQVFFSRFVHQKDKGQFFTRLNERLTTFTWQPREALDMGPWWRETAIENPNAEPITNLITDELWSTLFQWRVAKAIADARKIAVPTGDEDAADRWKRLSSVLEIAWNVFNFGAMLVPGLGEAMLGIMVGQMLTELAEGIEDWSKGDRKEASAYFNGVLLNFAQLALMGAGHLLPVKVIPVKTSGFVDQLKPVQMNGVERLWNPDLASYEYPAVLSRETRDHDLGVYQHEGRSLLPLEGNHYVITQDMETGRHRLQHPTRPEAYRPLLEHNGAGTWKTEIDQPLLWDKERLLRRLGNSVEGWSDVTLEQIRTVAGLSEDGLRRLHVELDAPPVMLTDTLTRFRLYTEAGKVGQQILADRVPGMLVQEVAGFMTDFPRWPKNRAIEIFEGLELKGQSRIIGDIDADSARRIKLTRVAFCTGKLPWRVLETLNEQEVHELLGQAISSQKELRVQALKELLASEATKKRRQLFERLYKQHEDAGPTQVYRLTNGYPQLPRTVAEQLLKDATARDLRHLAQKQTLPLRLREQVRQAEHRVRVSRAYEGLYLEGLENNDTRRLQLASLATLPGWSGDVRIEIREFFYKGNLHASVGAEAAPIRKILVLEDEGSYQTRDEYDRHLHGPDDFFSSLLHALPDNERRALGYDIFEGERLKSDLQRSPIDVEKFASMLNEYPVRKPAYDPETMRLRGGMPGYRRIVDESMLQHRFQSLYPGLSGEEITQMLGPLTIATEARVAALEVEFNLLDKMLRRWMDGPTRHYRFTPSGALEWNSRNRVCKAIRQCWQRTGPRGVDAPGIIGAQYLDLGGLTMGHHLTTFPGLAANFDHVTSLSMRESNLLSSQGSFIENFRNLRTLELSQNLLNRVPPVIGDLRHLIHLGLDRNQIVLTQQAVTRLRGLRRLQRLYLSENPLGLVPDISQMPSLEVLDLERTGIHQWPIGLFGKSRPRSIYLNLGFNHLTEIPDVAPGSFRAELLGRTIVSREPEWMPADVLTALRTYTESVGLDPERPYPPRGLLDSLQWSQGMPEPVFRNRLPLWDALEDESGSEPFFNEIRKLTQSADFKSEHSSYRNELTAKVWRMFEAMYENSELREEIFAEATLTTNCADGGTQLFNALGLKVRIHEAYALRSPPLVETELLELARGKSRLDELGAIARSRVADRLADGEAFMREDADGNLRGTIDEVEVHLAYMTDLAERLDLPWQSRGMLFRTLAKVSKEMIEAAYARVLALEQGELLVDKVLEQPFWQRYLEDTYRSDFDTLMFERPGETEEQIMAQFTAIKDLQRTLTRQAVERAKLTRIEIPFTVQPAS